MKRTIHKITHLAVCVAAVVCVPALSHADETNTAPATAPAAPDQSGPTLAGRSRNVYGPVTAVDTNAMTLTVGGQTYTVTGKTEIPKIKDGKAATPTATVALAGVVVGESARFTYVKGTDGKLYVTKLRLGKEADDYIGGGKKKKAMGATDSDSKASPPQNQ